MEAHNNKDFETISTMNHDSIVVNLYDGQNLFGSEAHLNLLKGYFGTHHLFGWNIIRDEILKNFKHNEDGIILDIFCERTFHSSWEKNW